MFHLADDVLRWDNQPDEIDQKIVVGKWHMNYARHHHIKQTSITYHDISKQKGEKKLKTKMGKTVLGCVVITHLDMC